MNSDKKTISAKQIYIKNNDTDLMFLSKSLDKMENRHPIDVICWQNFSYKPEVNFKIAYTDQAILLKVYVKENYIRAKYNQSNDPVYRDSCFEFFISVDQDNSYYNFEFNCIGTPYQAYMKQGEKRVKAASEIVKSIRTMSTLGNQTFEEKQGDFEWEMTILIPLKSFFNHDLKALKGKACNVNFYKCGDELTKQHFLTWNIIETENPDFHRPEFFGKLLFVDEFILE